MSDATSAPARVAYNFAVLRVVPHVHLGAFVNVGVVVHARTAGFVGIRLVTDAAELAARVPDLDTELLAKYLRSCRGICEGDAEWGPVALAPPSERFHWLTAPRSDVLQCSPVHVGICESPQRALDDLFATYVRPGG
ncbi:MAG TPA: DUF3037 domain-containing protein [Longimicrobiaceae bacterium]|jgi:hypothetical protein|nr:DUF3037 domain-containing protein [Longimicrobiaceae bacterium]